ncbi:24073_t:CDS:2, partial [Racocetra persica]
ETFLLRASAIAFTPQEKNLSTISNRSLVDIIKNEYNPEIEEKNYRGKYFEPFGKESELTSYAYDDELAKKKTLGIY